MWKEFFRFDLRYQLRQPLLWITTLPLMLIAFLSASNDGFRIGGGIGNIHMNAPVVIANQLSVLSIVAMFLVTVFIAGAVLRDSEVGISDMLFATPMRKRDYLFGRFLAGLFACLGVFALITAAMMLGSSMPTIDPARIGPFSLWSYAWSFGVFVVPNLLFVAALLMLLAATTRSMIMVYVGVLAFLVLWSATGFLGSAAEGSRIGALLDPFGVRVLAQTTRYYTTAESNTLLPSLSGLLLVNRIGWSVLSLGLFAATVALFKPQRAGTGRRWFGKAARPAAPTTVAAPPIMLRRVEPRFRAATAWAQCWSLLKFDARGILTSMPFLVMLMLALANFIANYTIGGMRFDSTPYPLTRLMLDELGGSINMVLVIVLVFYSAELIFKERQARISDLVDALPVPGWVPLLAKCGALIAVIFAFLSAGVLTAIGIQLLKGGAPIEGLLYVEGTLIGSTYFVLMALALLAVQAVIGHRYIGYVFAIGLFLSGAVLEGNGFDNRLYTYASLPALIYSDINGYGHYLAGWRWFALYWSLCAIALLIVAQAFWIRGAAPGWRRRCADAWRAMRGPAGAAFALCVAGCASTGGWIYYNTHVLNRHLSAAELLDARADYEKTYRGDLDLPQPSITGVRADVDIFPEQREATIKGHYVLQNKGDAPVETLRIHNDPTVDTQIDRLSAHRIVQDDRRLGVQTVALDEPLQPGATLAFDFTVQVRNPGFTNSGAPTAINRNGTLFAFEDYFPRFGYNQSLEIEDRNERRARGLGEPQRMPKLEDRQAQHDNFWKLFGVDADLIDFETTVSTSADQTAIAPGTLESSWEKDGRRYFHYRMDQPILPFVSYQSARWNVAQSDWRGLPIRVYFDDKHRWNVDRMIAGAQGALDYNTENFGPYPHRQLQIVETPLYQTYARSFPMTIPFSESLGFINDLRDPEAVDHVFYVTAHEVAHQWWGDQAIAANVQGSGMITESLAEYSALMAVERRFGAEKVRHILRFDLDEYLRGRSQERVEELPLFRTENQVYVQYRKGSLVFYRLREEIGEVALNRALKRFLDENRYRTSPYLTSRELLDCIRAETPADKQGLVTDLFERIVLYDNRVLAATAAQRADGRWDVTMTVSLAKREADGDGTETERAYDEPVDIAVFARADGASERDERILHRQKTRLPAGESTLTITVDEQPHEVGVDPYHLLIDRVIDDNRKRIEE